MTVYDDLVGKRGFRVKVKWFGYKHAFKLIFLAGWGLLFWLGEVILRVAF